MRLAASDPEQRFALLDRLVVEGQHPHDPAPPGRAHRHSPALGQDLAQQRSRLDPFSLGMELVGRHVKRPGAGETTSLSLRDATS
jgi:hypothetical protein